jgi:glutamate-1-semialdehyde aminotransferase/acyl carrier protein
MSKPTQVAGPESNRHGEILLALKNGFGRLFGIDPAEFETDTHFLEMGADSLLLLRASQAIQSEFGVKVPFRMMFDEVSTIHDMALYLDQRVSIDLQLHTAVSPSDLGLSNLGGQTADLEPNVAVEQPDLAASEPEPHGLSHQLISAHPAVPAAGDIHERLNGQEIGPVPHTALERIFSQQLQVMAYQLDLLNGKTQVLERPITQPEASGGLHRSAAQAEKAAIHVQPGVSCVAQTSSKTFDVQPGRFVPYQTSAIGSRSNEPFSPVQKEHLADLIERVTARTFQSKQVAGQYRSVLADNRATAGFNVYWKEMQYPLIADRASGSRLWDIDGNEYVDLTMGFGALLFGHSPSFVMEALHEQIGRGFQLGAESRMSGKVAQLICELTGAERVTFCNSGTEAVMAALRLARTVTGRTKIALFEGCYHGTFDGVMVARDWSAEGSMRAVPAAPGIPQRMIDDIILLKIGDPESLERLRAHAHELAAVLIEPMPSRFPDMKPEAFLRELRQVTTEGGIALIFDEVVTGFRFHPAGAQALFGVKADLLTYGKAIGAGLPVAVVAGKSEYLDAIDGGMWNYGDRSYPRAETTFFAGTFFKQPLVMAPVWAVLNHIKDSGPALQQRLGERTSRLVQRLNDQFNEKQVPIQVASFGSLFRFLYTPALKHMELFFYHLLEKGVYICETRSCFLSTAHSDEDMDLVVRAVRDSIAQMQAGGFLPTALSGKPAKDPPNSSARAETSGLSAAGPKPIISCEPSIPPEGSDFRADSVRRLPITDAQRGLWVVAQFGDEGSRAYNETLSIRLTGHLDPKALTESIQEVVNRHDALRMTFSPDGESVLIAQSMTIALPVIDLTAGHNGDIEDTLTKSVSLESNRVFDIVRGPLLRGKVVKLGEDHHVLVLVIHHLITDGVSNTILLNEIKDYYAAQCQGTALALPPAAQFSEYILRQMAQREGPEMQEAEAYWKERFSGSIPTLALPVDRPRPSVQTYAGSRERLSIDGSLYNALRTWSARTGVTPLMFLLAGFYALLYRITSQSDIVVGILSAGQLEMEDPNLVGFCVNVLPLRLQISDERSFKEFLIEIKTAVLDAQSHQIYPFRKLLKELNLAREPSAPPLVAVVFNIDHQDSDLQFFDLEASYIEPPSVSARFDLHWNLIEIGSDLVLDCVYNRDVFEPDTIRGWLQDYQILLQSAVAHPENSLNALTSLLAQPDRAQLVKDEKLKIARAAKFDKMKKSVAAGSTETSKETQS